MPIRAILFDKDGTLVDFQRTWGPATHSVLTEICNGDREAFARVCKVSLYDPEQRILLPGSPVVIETTYGYGKLWAEALGVPLNAEFVDKVDRMYFHTTLDNLTGMGDVKALLERLRAQGLRTGIMTNDADANTRAQLAKLGITDLIEFLAAYDSGYGHKPDADPVLAFAKHVGVAPDEIAVVGDTLHDLEAARNAGSVAVAVASGPTPREKLEPHADVLLPSIAKLEEWLSSIGPRG